MEKLIFTGNVDHTDKYYYPPFCLSLFVGIPTLFISIATFFSITHLVVCIVFGIIFLADYRFYKELMNIETWEVFQKENGFLLNIWKEGILKNSFQFQKLDFWFEQHFAGKGSGGYGGANIQVPRSGGGSNLGGEGGSPVTYTLFTKLTNEENEEIILRETLTEWADYPNGWRYEWQNLPKETKIIHTFNLTELKKIIENLKTK